MNFKINVEILLSKILEMFNLWLREKLKKKKNYMQNLNIALPSKYIMQCRVFIGHLY